MPITFPASIPVSWENPVAAAQGVTAHTVYLDGIVAETVPAPGLSTVVVVATPGLHTFEVAAVNPDGEGPKATALNFVGAPDAPINVTITRLP